MTAEFAICMFTRRNIQMNKVFEIVFKFILQVYKNMQKCIISIVSTCYMDYICS